VHGLFDDARLLPVAGDQLAPGGGGFVAAAGGGWLSQRDFTSRLYARLSQWLADHCDLLPSALP